ncbi:uncharacterized protein LOC106169522 isoform X2 [Lingula anatina]|uniref:Uncharacterized protein LOC106169522 isoform X2 n=1 Tax=Lingula anatina TaxID=7574 RepID=A0A1S3J2H3_LINAN|nr:uncharacterized protein LOC106169522 isoform X2 [Lingula anatina]|eukprot:XP_013404448.1 uncharacterized protein LOC106169522 isoform X2 [Lingula anatina]
MKMAEGCSNIATGHPPVSIDYLKRTEANEIQDKATRLLTDRAKQDHFENDSDSEADEVFQKKFSYSSLRRSERYRNEIDDLKIRLEEANCEIRKLRRREETMRRQHEDVCQSYKAATKTIFHLQASNDNVSQKMTESFDKCLSLRTVSPDTTSEIINEIHRNGQNVIDTLKREINEALQKKEAGPNYGVTDTELKTFSKLYAPKLDEKWRSFSLALGLTEDAINGLGARHDPQKFGYEMLLFQVLKHWSRTTQNVSSQQIIQAAEAVGVERGAVDSGCANVPDVADVQAVFKADPGLEGFCSRLADSLGSQWRHLARRLGMHGEYLDRLEVIYGKFGSSELVWCVLEHWVKTSKTPSRDDLERAVHEIGAFYVQDEPMEPLHRDVIHHNLAYLYKELMSVELLFPGLLQKRVISQALVDEIKICRGDSERKMKFLAMLPNLGCRAFPAFIEEVDRRQRHVAQKLREDVARRGGDLVEPEKPMVNTETQPCQHQVPSGEPQNCVINDCSTSENRRRPTQLNVKKRIHKVPMPTGKLRNMEGALVSAESDSSHLTMANNDQQLCTVNGDDASGNRQILNQNGNEQNVLRQRRVNCASSNTLMQGGAHIVRVPRNRRRRPQETEKNRKCCVVS